MNFYRVSIASNISDASVSKIVCLTCGAIVGMSLGFLLKERLTVKLKRFYQSNFKPQSKNKLHLVNNNFNMTEANFKYTFNNITEIRMWRKDVFSPEIWIGDLPWKIMLRPTKLCLEAHVICSEIYCFWSCCIHLQFSLLGKAPRILAAEDELHEADTQNEYNRNMGQNIPWEQLLDPGNMYVHDDSITFQVALKVEILERISWSDKLYLMDEKANSLVKKYKTNMDMLRTRIKQLSKRNKQLEEDMKLLKMYKNSHFL